MGNWNLEDIAVWISKTVLLMGYTSYTLSALRKGWYPFHRERISYSMFKKLPGKVSVYLDQSCRGQKLLSIGYKMLQCTCIPEEWRALKLLLGVACLEMLQLCDILSLF